MSVLAVLAGVQQAEFVHGVAHALGVGFADGGEREAAVGAGVAQQVGGVFDRHGVAVGEHRVVQREETVLQGDGVGDAAFAPGDVDVGAEARGDVGGDGDAAVAAGGEEAQDGVVFAGELDEVAAAGGACVERAREVCCRVLDADDELVRGEARHGFDAHVDDAAAWDVVDDERQAGGFGDGVEMQEEALLARLVVVGGDDHGGVRADALGVLGERDGFGGAVGAGAGDDGDAVVGDFDGDFDGASVLGVAEGWAFACGADGDEAFGAVVDLPGDEFGEGLFVEAAVVAHRGDQGSERSLKHGSDFRL